MCVKGWMWLEKRYISALPFTTADREHLEINSFFVCPFFTRIVPMEIQVLHSLQIRSLLWKRALATPKIPSSSHFSRRPLAIVSVSQITACNYPNQLILVSTRCLTCHYYKCCFYYNSCTVVLLACKTATMKLTELSRDQQNNRTLYTL